MSDKEPVSRDTNPIDLAIGRRIRELRQHAELSMAALADSVGLSFQQIQKYETGVNRISPGVLADIAKVFGVPISFLFPVEAEALPDERNISVLRAEARQLVDDLKTAPDLVASIMFLRILVHGKQSLP